MVVSLPFLKLRFMCINSPHVALTGKVNTFILVEDNSLEQQLGKPNTASEANCSSSRDLLFPARMMQKRIFIHRAWPFPGNPRDGFAFKLLSMSNIEELSLQGLLFEVLFYSCLPRFKVVLPLSRRTFLAVFSTCFSSLIRFMRHSRSPASNRRLLQHCKI